MKGFRISTGPRGTYLNAGRKGFYYRKKLDAKKHGLYASPMAGAETVGIVALVFAGLVALGFIGLVALVSPLVAVGLLIALVIISVAIIAALSSGPTESEQLQSEEAEPSPNIPNGPDQMVIAALMTFVEDGSVHVSTQLLGLKLNVSNEDAVAIICKLQIFGLIREEPDYAGYKRFTLTNRALAVAELLRITNFRQSLQDLRPPPPHDVLGIRPGALITDVMAAYKLKRANYDPKKYSN